MMILLVLIIILILFISFNNEKFTLVANNDDIFITDKETINTEVPCYVNGDTNITGYETIITAKDKSYIQTCDFGNAKQENNDYTCDHLNIGCYSSDCTKERVVPLLNINGEYKCRKVPYQY